MTAGTPAGEPPIDCVAAEKNSVTLYWLLSVVPLVEDKYVVGTTLTKYLVAPTSSSLLLSARL
eukprot:CAMPEP_0119185078 /NCGR_PEP_ID=MMETSP1315-20130426/67890_1 /TAXON_ID=676789 /ORGANISM="Prasinoderma singularis, Strain RCC927" /LENGTH=62 /DNA_ID=CAMNT_0007179505 /DNA_START=133 /DNA_END=318 /DNA_ORIENTATION=+